MDEYATRTYGTSVQDNRPLFGETSARDRIINIVVGVLTSLLLIVTIISSFVFPQLPPKPLNVFFVVCILLSCASIGVLIGVRDTARTEIGAGPGNARSLAATSFQGKVLVFCP
ncbi:transmembrane protein 243b isoform X2 [Scyliorhinus torazame]|uniref:transmembrane protein 243b isoform X2 n=1 Tax=Scyliorhinus torazame TaxID=75743 RepID=UPI003B59B992